MSEKIAVRVVTSSAGDPKKSPLTISTKTWTKKVVASMRSKAKRALAVDVFHLVHYR